MRTSILTTTTLTLFLLAGPALADATLLGPEERECRRSNHSNHHSGETPDGGSYWNSYESRSVDCSSDQTLLAADAGERRVAVERAGQTSDGSFRHYGGWHDSRGSGHYDADSVNRGGYDTTTASVSGPYGEREELSVTCQEQGSIGASRSVFWSQNWSYEWSGVYEYETRQCQTGKTKTVSAEGYDAEVGAWASDRASRTCWSAEGGSMVCDEEHATTATGEVGIRYHGRDVYRAKAEQSAAPPVPFLP